MSRIRLNFIISLFMFFYSIQLLDNIDIENYIFDNVSFILFFYFFIFLFFYFFIYIKSYFLFIQVIIFVVLFACYFIIEQTILKVFMYSIGGSGGWIRIHIYEDILYQFQWYEVLFWNFIFSLHYPLYIFIFFKPFVNHIDKSIRKIKERDEKSTS
jgi:hypothetical protein